MITPLSNSTDLLEPGYDSVFLLPGTVEDEAVFAVESMPRLGGHRLAVVHDGTSFPLTLAQSTAAVARRPGSPVTLAAELELSQGAPSYARVAEAVVSAGADVVYFTGYYAEGNRLIVDLRRLGFSGPILVGDGADGPLLENLTPEQHVDVYGTQLLVPDFMPEIADWAKRFEAVVGSPPGLCTVEAYDAVTLALDAIRRAGTVERGAVRAAIAGTTELDLLSGPARFNANGTRMNPKFLLLRVREGGFDAVSPAPPR
jgi:branched-chain amino acid transport system substrate-binding protein